MKKYTEMRNTSNTTANEAPTDQATTTSTSAKTTKAKSTRKKATPYEPVSIFDAFDHMLKVGREADWNESAMKNPVMVGSLDYLCRRLSCTPQQCMILGAILETSDGSYSSVSELANFFCWTTVHFLSHQPDLDALCEKQLIQRAFNRFGKRVYQISLDVLTAFEKDEIILTPTPLMKTDNDFFAQMDKLYAQRNDGDIGVETLNEEVQRLMEQGANLPVVKKFEQMAKNLPSDERALLLHMVVCKYRNGCNSFTPRDFRFIFSSNDYRTMVYKLVDRCALITRKMVMPRTDNKHPLNGQYMLGPSVDKKFGLEEAKSDNSETNIDNKKECLGRLVKHDDILVKQLFHNDEEAHSLAMLQDLLMPDNYSRVQKELAAEGMRGSINVLLYGGPGTGKTESVQQLAQRTGRDLFVVDLSQMRDRWVGSSEKNVKSIFDEYRQMVKSSKVTPILFVNEADGLLGKRLTNVDGGSERMENTMQNIMLQEMEILQGIMICTTNLASNLDSAFERRFLMKLELHSPNAEVRAKIWHALIPALSDKEVATLARDYELAGGNIENVSRKRTMEKILTGQEVSLDRLKELCSQELIGDISGKPHKIGF